MKTVTIIGGSGARNTLKALRKIKNVKINNIVTMFDSGGSTGYLRKKFGIYALGDLRDRILAVSENESLRDISSQRIEMDGINHNIGNLLLYGLVKKYDKGYLEIAKGMFKTPKNIDFIPIVDNINCSANLVIKTDKGEFIGEDSLDSNSDREMKIQDVRLDKKAKISRTAADAIIKSDFLIFGPGDVYSSILPNTLVDGFDDTIAKSKAKKILIVNIMNKKSETNGFKTSDFVRLFEKKKIKIDYIIINEKTLPVQKIKGKYGSFSGWVENDLSDKRVIKGDFINENLPYEHDPNKILLPLKRIIK
jgi:uncharacterized cofD-like protein